MMAQALSQVQLFLIDDNPSEQILLREALLALSLGDQVEVSAFLDADSAMKGLQAMQNGPAAPGLILVDLMLYDVSGLELLTEIRQMCGYKNTPIALFTSSLRTEWYGEAYASGANAVILKPMVFEDWIDTLHNVLTFFALGD